MSATTAEGTLDAELKVRFSKLTDKDKNLVLDDLKSLLPNVARIDAKEVIGKMSPAALQWLLDYKTARLARMEARL